MTWVDDLRADVAKLDAPRAAHPRKPKECKRHEYIVNDRCYWCGSPMQALPAPKEEASTGG